MKNNPDQHQPNRPNEPAQTGGAAVGKNHQQPTKRTYKPRTPITKTTIKIMNDPYVFSC